jgi:cytochrome c oxidase assembly protein subunit 11
MNKPTLPATAQVPPRHWMVATACAVFVLLMLAMAYAAVPLYSLFCRTTGFGGTTRIATAAPATVLPRSLKVRFDANVASPLPWKFQPEREFVDVKLGEVVTVLFTVTNESGHDTVGQASYNVTPPTAGAYFAKINCFCFTEQPLKSGERRDMAVVFFLDPALASDSEQAGLNTITLSYTMFAIREREDQCGTACGRASRAGTLSAAPPAAPTTQRGSQHGDKSNGRGAL